MIALYFIFLFCLYQYVKAWFKQYFVAYLLHVAEILSNFAS